MWVAAPVSSMKTRRSGFSLPWLARHSFRAWATYHNPARQLAPTFFEREFEKIEPVPQAPDADFDLPLGEQPSLQFGERDVRARPQCVHEGHHHAAPASVWDRRRIGVRLLRRLCVAGSKPCKYRRRLDSKQRRGHIRASSRINCRNHTLTQVLRIWLAHYGLRINSTRRLKSQIQHSENPPIRMKMHIDFRARRRANHPCKGAKYLQHRLCIIRRGQMTLAG